jgi:TolA-binding protein
MSKFNRSVGRPAWAAVLLAVCLTLCAPARAEQDDRKADALFETAMATFKLGRHEDAGTKFYDFMASFPHDPRNAEAQYYVARSYHHRNYLNKAIEEYGFAIDDFPNSPYAALALHDRSECRLAARQQEQAIADKEKVIRTPVQIYHGDQNALLRQLYENHRADVYWLAKYYLDNKRYDEAVAAYQRLPYPMEAFRRVVDVYYDLQNYDKIRELIDGLTEQNRHEGFKYLIEFYAVRKAHNQLKGIFEKLLAEKSPDEATDDLVWTTGSNFQHLGWDQWDWAMKRISDHYPRLTRRADFELAKRHWQEGGYLDDLELFVLKHRNGADVDTVLRWKGITLERTGKADEARAAYRRISNSAVGHWFVAESWHGAYAQKKDCDAAINEYLEIRKAFYSIEWAAMAQWRVAELHRQLKHVDQAVDAYRQIVKRFGTLTQEQTFYGNHPNTGYVSIGVPRRDYGPEAQLALADVLREAARYEHAILEYRTLVQKWSKTDQASVGAYRTGLCYEGLQDGETAVKVFKSVLRLYAKTSAASEAHTRLEQKYGVPDTEVTDDLDFFSTEAEKRKNYLENPDKMKR